MRAARKRWELIPDAIYLCDNGAAYCGKHLGHSAKTTGRDLSGQAVLKVTAADADAAKREGWTVKCESCGVAA